jgi:two-component system nitrate/nitrite response regulator NarL
MTPSAQAVATGSYRIYLLDDQAMLRAAFRNWLSRHPGLQVVGDQGDARLGIAEIGRLRPDVVLLDIAMPGLSGLDAIAPIKAANPAGHVLMMTNHEGESFVRQALDAGADGYLSKDSDPEELVLAIGTVSRGERYVSPRVAPSLAFAAPGATAREGGVASLTAREREVFLLLAVGKSNKEVAKALTMSLGTAKKHRENLQRKLDCHSTADLARLAIREGLLPS